VPGETGGYGRAVIMNINRRMMVVVVVWVENGETTRIGRAASEGDRSGGLKTAGRGMKMTPGIRRLPSFNFN